MLFKASAPGSLMLLGEYAVLHKQHALVCAIDKRIYVTLTPRSDKQIILESALGHYQTTLSSLKSVAPFQFVLAALCILKKNLKQGCHIVIESEFSATVGFASSAAVTVATLSALSHWLELSLSQTTLIKLARKVILQVQGLGSGADVAACVLGGVVLYRIKPFIAKKIPIIFPLTVVYSGGKTPTVVAVKQVTEAFSQFPHLFQQIIKAINQCTISGVTALQCKDWRKLGKIMNVQQGLLDSLGVNTPILNEIILKLRSQPELFGAKISGSGLGDCVIALGESSLAHCEVQQIAIQMTQEGVRCEKN